MTTDQNISEEDSGTINRRSVLKTAGTGVLAASGLVGTASAHTVQSPVVFCGCGQVCACGDGVAEVIVAEPGRGGHTEKRFTRSFNFCATPGDASSPGGKIVAIEVEGTVICNPNNCAERPLDDLDLDCDDFGVSGGPCGHPPCEHPSGQWDA